MPTTYDALLGSYREYINESNTAKLKAAALFRDKFPNHPLVEVNLFVSSEPAAVEFRYDGEPMDEDTQMAFAVEVKDRLGGFSSWFIHGQDDDAG